MGLDALPVIVCRADLPALGMSAHQLYAMVRSGQLQQISPGIYRKVGRVDDATAALASIAVRNSAATICLLSALALHQLSDVTPTVIDIALPRGARTLRSPRAQIRWHAFDRQTFAIGRNPYGLTSDDVPIGLYSAERSIIDAFRLRHKIGPSTAIEALVRWLAKPDSVPAALLEMSQAFPKAAPAIRSTLQVLLTRRAFVTASGQTATANHVQPQNGITMSATLFGSISTVADTSELQRAAFNQAFATHGLDWHWDRDNYRAMLATSGGRDRVSTFARSLGQDVDAQAIHETKSRIFQESLGSAQLTPRPGVLETIHSAKSNGWKVGLVTTTSRENVRALLTALSPTVRSEDFDVIVDSSTVALSKPDHAAYTYALGSLGEQAKDCVAIEDNIDGVQAAVAAGLACVAFPNENTSAQEFSKAKRQVDRLDPVELQQLLQAS